MPTYRAYLVDRDGHLHSPTIEIEAAGDAEAIEAAKVYVDGHDIALWDGERPVTTLKRATAAADQVRAPRTGLIP